MISSINNNGKEIQYTYDANGNIETILENNKKIKYYYNELNELIREDNEVLNKTIVYSYDDGGNIKSKKEYSYSTGIPTTETSVNSYTYDSNWKDKLISYNGKAITYDEIGNPKTYNNYTYTWERGRALKSISGNGLSASYKYNDEGIRIEKTVNNVKTKYYLSGDKVVFEDNGTDKIYYTYEAAGQLASMNLNGVEYYYIRNAQGDVIGLFDKNGVTVASYTYDSWGKLISIKDQNGVNVTNTVTHVGYKNPYRYRGYRYDTEIQMYYLQSRYYNPEWGRFINADGVVGALGNVLSHNMFTYCNNNPVNLQDADGHFAIPIIIAIAATVALLLISTVVVSAPTLPKEVYLPEVNTITPNNAFALITMGATAYAQSRSKSKREERNNSVYVLVDNNNTARYVGRTKQTVSERYKQHKRTGLAKGLTPTTIGENLTYAEARGLEQIAYDYYKHAGNNLKNRIRPISPLNPFGLYYTAEGAKAIIRWDLIDDIKEHDNH